MSDVYGSPPTFTAGQVLSASGHLNALQGYINALHDDFVGVNLPFCGLHQVDSWRWTYNYSGIIRHKYDLFDYKIEILAGGDSEGPVEIRIDGKTVPGSSHTGIGTHSATGVDISSLGLTVGNFYEVTLYGPTGPRMAVWLMRETATLSLPTLAAFTDDTTPSAAEWQDLSDYATVLANGLQRPQQLGLATYYSNFSAGNQTADRAVHLKGTANHRGRYLAYSITVVPPYHRQDYTGDTIIGYDEVGDPVLAPEPWSPRWTNALVRINGYLVMVLRNGEQDLTVPAGVYKEFRAHYGVGNCPAETFTGELDLDTYALSSGLVIGDDYEITVSIESTTDGAGNGGVNYLYEVPGSAPALAGWSDFVTWVHGQMVWGSEFIAFGDARALDIKDNLEALGALLAAENFPSPIAYSWHDSSDINDPAHHMNLFGVRRWRWLHYVTLPQHSSSESPTHDRANEIYSAPVIVYNYKGKEVSVTLDNTYVDDEDTKTWVSKGWQAKDLDSVEGLYPGTVYRLENVRYALEDASV